MMAVNAILHVAVLAIGTRIQSSQKSDGIDLVLGRLVFVLKATTLSLGTRTPEVMIVAQFVAVLPLLDAVKRRL